MIAERRPLISDYPVNIKPDARQFSARNRIISGFPSASSSSKAIKSARMITCEFALETRPRSLLPSRQHLSRQARTQQTHSRNPAPNSSPAFRTSSKNSTSHDCRKARPACVVPSNDTEAVLLKYLSAEPTTSTKSANKAAYPSLRSPPPSPSWTQGTHPSNGSMTRHHRPAARPPIYSDF